MELYKKARFIALRLLHVSHYHQDAVRFLPDKRRVPDRFIRQLLNFARAFFGMTEQEDYELVLNRKGLQDPDYCADFNRWIPGPGNIKQIVQMIDKHDAGMEFLE